MRSSEDMFRCMASKKLEALLLSSLCMAPNDGNSKKKQMAETSILHVEHWNAKSSGVLIFLASENTFYAKEH
jgi:hypothetical protein